MPAIVIGDIMIRISNIKYPIELLEENIPEYIIKKYKITNLKSFRIVKQSIDARKKNDIHYAYTVDISSDNEKQLLKNYKNITVPKDNYYRLPKATKAKEDVAIIGFGPAGIMCAHTLTKLGYNVTVIERGQAVEERILAVNALKNHGILNTESNIQFGEGGAGTFSDGKLTTGVNDVRIDYVLQEFAKHGAPNEITYRAKPHIGTDNLVKMVKAFREDIISMGGKILFSHKLVDIEINDNKITGIVIENNNKRIILKTDILVLATGHSARDVFSMLKEKKVDMERKVFAIGARIEHLQENINKAQYGEMFNLLPSADYKLSVKTSTGKNVYTFCMCPGGEVVASTSEKGCVVTNGMSLFARNNDNANSALLVNVTPDDLSGGDVLEGCKFQYEIEKKAFEISGGYFAPCQTVGDFLYNDNSQPVVTPSYKPGVKYTKLDYVLPEFVTDAIREALPLLDMKLHGFADKGAVLTAPETRSSSPVRIIRNPETMMSNISGLYPCGEGAGYAGGIMTAAIDGIKIAEAIVKRGNKIE